MLLALALVLLLVHSAGGGAGAPLHRILGLQAHNHLTRWQLQTCACLRRERSPCAVDDALTTYTDRNFFLAEDGTIVIQPMPSCFVNGSSTPLTNLSVECDAVTHAPLKVDEKNDGGDSAPPQRYTYAWADGNLVTETFQHGQFGIKPRNATVNSQFSNSWPRLHKDGTIVNGGVPQFGNLSLHLEEWSACVDNEKHGGPTTCTNTPGGFWDCVPPDFDGNCVM